jgi:hypothetical protein
MSAQSDLKGQRRKISGSLFTGQSEFVTAYHRFRGADACIHEQGLITQNAYANMHDPG